MAQFKGWRKILTVLAFIAPTIIGILIFNIYPILFNTYISFTNRNKFHPNADCSLPLTNILEPTCWDVFKKNAPIGLSEPFRLKEPLFGNYIDLMGQLFTKEVLWAALSVIVCIIPLIISGQVNKHLGKRPERPIPGWAVTALGIALTVLLAFVFNARANLELIGKSGDFLVVNLHSVIYVAICIPLFLLLALSLALLLNVPDLPGRTFFRVALIVPWAASTVAIMMSLVWRFFFQELGTINQLLEAIGLEGKPWLQDPTWAFAVVIIANVWYSYPFFMVTILGALQSIPVELYEAAEVDGASWWRWLTGITLPLIRPAIIPAIVLSSITTFQMFGTVWAITGGGPTRGAGTPGATEMVMVFAYKQVFQTQAYARMGAFAVIMFIVLFGATLYSLRVSRITRGAYE
ncbi:MAG: sugar ABC transporter permease [Chloroflexi bacterium]|nr:sugar ABC transporter permease [Chloroflexota bacterium]